MGQGIGVVAKCVVIVAITLGASLLSSRLWSEAPEKTHVAQTIVYDSGMTVAEFGQQNDLPAPLLKKVFGLRSPSDRQQTLQETGYSKAEVLAKVDKWLTLLSEHGSKNWKKILTKFIAWFIALLGMFFVLQRRKLTNRNRIVIYAAAVVVFGVVLGSDPGPMGTIKDAIALFGAKRVIFPPRIVALAVFLLTVVLANKFICSWGCQAGTLQDLLFRINRDDKDKPILRQFRIPFRVGNSIRIAFFIAFTAVAFLWGFDLVAPIDPFKVFKPTALGIVGFAAIGIILVASIFVYRPWCHLFCPFGLASWLLERFSFNKVKVDYDTCIACEKCSSACPSTVMDAILKQDRTIPDCFSCGSCITTCPVQAISFGSGKSQRPPAGKFSGEEEQPKTTPE